MQPAVRMGAPCMKCKWLMLLACIQRSHNQHSVLALNTGSPPTTAATEARTYPFACSGSSNAMQCTKCAKTCAAINIS